MIDGDRNSSYFHKQAATRNNINCVQEIHIQDRIISSHEEIKKEATRHFSGLFKAQPVLDDAELMTLIPNVIKTSENESLTQAITMEEIKRVVDGMKDDRAPRPDGFNGTFVKLCWNIIKNDLIKMVRKSQRCSKIGGSTNSAFLALIPKEKEAKYFDKFQPIFVQYRL